MATAHSAREKRVRVLVESLMGPDTAAPRRDVLDFLLAGEHALAVETFADWIGEQGDASLVSPADRAELFDLVSDFPATTRDRVRRAVAD